MATRRELILTVGKRYQEAAKQQRGAILDELTKITGYHRKHAIRVLCATSAASAKQKKSRPRLYDKAVVDVLI